MTTIASTTSTPPLAKLSPNSASYNTPMHEDLPNLHPDSHSIHSNRSSSPELRPVNLGSPIPEEDEDETSSEAANEPITPTDIHLPHTFTDRTKNTMTQEVEPHHAFTTIQPPPLIINTHATPPPPPSASQMDGTPTTEQQTPKTTFSRRPGSSSKDSSIKRGFSAIFNRKPHGGSHDVAPLTQADGNAPGNGSDPTLGKESRRLSMSIRRMSANNTPPANRSPNTTRSNTPPSPGSLAENAVGKSQKHLQVQEPTDKDLFKNKNKKERSFTARLAAFAPSQKHHEHDQHRLRATSVDLEVVPSNPLDESNPSLQAPERAIWALPAETGIGLKSRRMSLSLPDDFTVDVAELYSEFSDQSMLIGRRGKSVGKGATSKVKLMNRKGYSSEVYAVKEFRGKSSTEKSEDYEQKVKSEYSIAKSVHHPNIVETFRLCTHNGKWNHVMEYCDQGDLFNLVSQKYLHKEDHKVDRLCLFKQLTQGLNYLHNNGIAHRDVKLENLLITKDSKLKITDFGVSEVFAGIHPGLRSAGGQCGKEMGEIRLCAPGMCGSPPYVAPEVWEKTGKNCGFVFQIQTLTSS